MVRIQRIPVWPCVGAVSLGDALLRSSPDWRKQCITARRKSVSRLMSTNPLISLAGIRQQRDWAAAVTCLVGVMVGSDLAWKKARFGNIVSWIGAEFAVQNNGVIVSMSDDRVSKIRVRLEEPLRAKGMVARLEKVGRRVELVRWIDTSHSPVLLPIMGSHP